jgi:hypothetical protein
MKKTLAIIAMLVLAWTCALWADEVQVAGTLDRNQVQVNEEIALTIRIVGAKGNLQAPRLPPFQGFESFYTGRTSHFTFVGGRSSNTVEFTYVLVPKVAGKYVLQPVEVWIEGRAYQTLPLEIEVIGSAPVQPSRPGQWPVPAVPPAPSPAVAPAAAPPSAPARFVADENIFVKATVDKTTVYPNEQILLTYSLFTRYDTRYEGFEEEPSVSGFWIEDFPLERDLARDTVTVGGRRYMRADVRKIALFPTAPAEYTIYPGILKASIREEPRTTSVFDDFFGDSFFSGGGFFTRRVDRLLKPEPIRVNVRPFPEKGKPESFNGAVGQFRMEAAVDRSQVKQNEPVTLRLIFEGEGNIETLPQPPVPELTGFKVYAGDSKSELLKMGPGIGGKKTIEIIFIPTEAGDLAIPPLEFSYFDPRRETYQILRTPSFSLKVIPSSEPARLPAEIAEKEAFKKEIRREAHDIYTIIEELPSGRTAEIQGLLYRVLAAANFLGLLLVGSGLLRRRQALLFARDTALRRRKTARSVAGRRLKTLHRLARSRNPEAAVRFLQEGEKLLEEYFCNKFNASSYNFTREWFEEKLKEVCGPEDPLVDRAREFYDLAEEARFGKGAPPVRERHELLQVIESILHRMERGHG